MDCITVQTELLRELEHDESLSPDLAAHIEGCTECRAFAEAARGIDAIRMDTAPPPELDRRILDVAAGEQQRLRRSQPRQFVLSGPVLRFAAAASFALLALACGLAIRSAWRATDPALVKGPVPPVDEETPVVDTALAWNLDSIDQEMLLLDAELATFDGAAALSDDEAGSGQEEQSLDDLLDQIQGTLLFEEETI